MKTIFTYVFFTCCVLFSWTCKNREFNNPVDASNALEAPEALEAGSVSEVCVNLKWNVPPPDPDYPNAHLTIFIERSTDSLNFVPVDTVDGATTARDIPGLYQVGTAYSFRLRMATTGKMSPYSNVATVVLTFAAPSDLIVQSIVETSALLKWSDNCSFESGFIIEQSSDGMHFAVVDSAGPNATSKDVAGEYHQDLAYFFRARARSQFNLSPYSNITATSCVLAGPSNLALVSIIDSTASIRWNDNSTFETGFEIERSSDGVTFSQAAMTGAGVSSTEVTGTYQAGVTYSFRVRARSLFHYSAFSNTVAGVIPVRDPQMIQIAGGTFQMGSTNGSEDEKPVHGVTLRTFYAEKYEVTYDKWTEVRSWGQSHGYTDLPAGQNGKNPSGSKNPVTNVGWYDVLKWCNARSEKEGFLPAYYTGSAQTSVYRTGELDLGSDAVKWNATGYRLPTEAEWEFAARGGTQSGGFNFSGSNTAGTVGWYAYNALLSTHSIGSKSANELGIFDMTGNVLEWCWDWYATYPASAQTNPRGSGTGLVRVLRGGSFLSSEDASRTAYRVGVGYPTLRADVNGFRCVQN
ncbi:MAG TPA: SUMF1/EgtB/PvdO family nonheme iron enzyme [Bacteroidota bacterium]|nr:SUMF1/EgtB/PvdO family nonheme iron enzyme [Bacteroidota bacterium]